MKIVILDALTYGDTPLAGFESIGETENGPAWTVASPAQSFVLAEAATLIVVSVPATVTRE